MEWAVDVVKMKRGLLLVIGDIGSGDVICVKTIPSMKEECIEEALAASLEERRPTYLLIDHALNTETIRTLLARKGIKPKRLSPQAPSVMGAVERIVRRAIAKHGEARSSPSSTHH